MRKSDVTKKDKKDIVHPNPDLKRVPYEYLKQYGVTLNELNEGYAFFIAFNDNEIKEKVRLLTIEKDMLISNNKERLNRIKQESDNYYKDFKEIERLESEIKEYSQKLFNAKIADAPAVKNALDKVYSEVTDIRKKIEDENIKHWGVDKIDFTTVKTICDEENAPVRAVIQKIDPNVLNKYFKGCNRFIKKDK